MICINIHIKNNIVISIPSKIAEKDGEPVKFQNEGKEYVRGNLSHCSLLYTLIKSMQNFITIRKN